MPFHSSQANAILALEACPGSLILSWPPLLPSACALHSSQRNYFKTSISSCPSCAQNSPVFLTQKVPTVTHKALHSPCPFSALSSLPRPRPSRTGPRAHMWTHTSMTQDQDLWAYSPQAWTLFLQKPRLTPSLCSSPFTRHRLSEAFADRPSVLVPPPLPSFFAFTAQSNIVSFSVGSVFIFYPPHGRVLPRAGIWGHCWGWGLRTVSGTPYRVNEWSFRGKMLLAVGSADKKTASGRSSDSPTVMWLVGIKTCF